MATLIFHKGFKDRYGLSKEILSFFQKLTDDPTNPSLHIEPVKAARDSRVRTGRINQKYRAVLFELHGKGDSHFVLVDVLNHDDAYALAVRTTLKINPITGVTELSQSEPDLSEVSSSEVSSSEVDSRAKALAAEKLAELQTTGPTPADTLTSFGLTEAALTDDLGLSPATARIAFSASSETEVQELLAAGPEWESDAVIGLLAGLSIAEIKEEFDLKPPAVSSTDDEALITGLDTPAARMEFAFAPGEQELKAIIESGSFDQWRVFLHPSQEAAVKVNHSGSSKIIGGAGTGKTVVVVHRTNYLLQQNPDARVLLTTYTRELANSLKSQMNLLNPRFKEAPTHGAPGLWISGIDALVQRVIDNAQATELNNAFASELGITASLKPRALDSRAEQRLWEDSAMRAGMGLPPEKSHPTFLSQEYSTVILGQRITEVKAYLRASRSGRGTPLSRSERKAVWATVEAFHSRCRAEGRFTFPAVACIAAGVVMQRGDRRFFDHVLIDEAQDFHPGHWRFLRACVKPGPNDIFFAEDSHQRIYGQRLVLSRFGIETRGKATKRLRLNYRTTAENLAYARSILDGVNWYSSDDELDTLDGYRSVRHGPEHFLLTSETQAEEAEKLAEHIRQWIAEDNVSIGILTRTRKRCDSIVTQLAEHGIEANVRRDASSAAHSKVSVMTMFNAKGLEFTHVILLDVNDKALPQQFLLAGLAEAEKDDALQRERALLYVAASRARDRLLVSVVGTPSSLLPAE